MKNHNCHSFDRYSKTFKASKEICSCGGLYNCVDLSKSNRDKLVLTCSNDICPSVTIAHRKSNGLAFDGADEPKATM